MKGAGVRAKNVDLSIIMIAANCAKRESEAARERDRERKSERQRESDLICIL